MSKATVMLGKTAKPKLIDTASWYTVSEKLDGQPVRIKWNRDTRKLEAVTRQDKPVTSIDHILDSLYNQVSDISGDIGGYPEIAGELYIPGLGSAEISGKARKHETCPDLKLYMFPEFQDGLCPTEHVRFIPYVSVSGGMLSEELFNIHGEISVSQWLHDSLSPFTINKHTSEAFEGYIARLVGDEWTHGKRSNNYLKIIEDPTIDLRVVGFEEAVSKEGAPLGRVGAFVCEWKGETCKVGAGKLSHAEASALLQQFVGDGISSCAPLIIEVKYKQDAKYTSPRQPTFQRFRYDKSEYQTSFEE